MTVFYDEEYIRVIDNAVSPELCRSIIELFEEDSARHHHDGDRYIELDIFAHKNKPRQLWSPTDIKLNRWQPLADELVGVVNTVMREYRERWDPLVMLPNDYAMEGMRVKCYRANTHSFKLHVDQGNRESSSRFLSFLLYLNDNEAGTEFVAPGPKLTVSARQGRVVIFPPTWQYPHIGQMPTESTKYILSTYLHYKD